MKPALLHTPRTAVTQMNAKLVPRMEAFRTRKRPEIWGGSADFGLISLTWFVKSDESGTVWPIHGFV